MVSSALGNALGLTEESTLEELKDKIVNVKDYSEAVMDAEYDGSTNTTTSRYIIQDDNVHIVPAIGYWAGWDFNSGVIKIPLSTVSKYTKLNGAFYGGGAWGSTYQTKSYVIPEGVTRFVAIATSQYGNSTSSTRNRQSHCSISVPSYTSVQYLMNSHMNDHTFYDGQWIVAIFQTDGKSQTITMVATNSGCMHYFMFGVVY